MEPISIRYGESLTLPLDAGDLSATSATIYIGRPGQVYTLTQNITLTDGLGAFVFSPAQTRIPVGTYYYQINVTDAQGYVEKYPSSDDACGEDEFPKFLVRESLDETEVVS